MTLVGGEPTEKMIERSRFITYSSHVESEKEAKEFLELLKEEHPFATHICYAFVADKQGNLQRFSDNGEPQGTAGLPILENLKNRDLAYTCVAVVRYFGGIKLGAGGLTRAYSACAKEHLDAADLREIKPCEVWSVTAEYAEAEPLKKFFEKRGVVQIETTYAEKAVFRVRIESERAETLKEELTDFLCGRADIRFEERCDGYFPVEKEG